MLCTEICNGWFTVKTMGNAYIWFVDRMHEVLVAKAGDRLCIKWLNQSALQLSEENSGSD